jgi:hypothetical protein
VSSRTIERDIASPQLAGVPIYADHGAYRRYSPLREYSLPPLNFAAAESLAVLAGLGLLESSPYQAAAGRAFAKSTAVLLEEHREPVQEMLRMIRVIDPVALTGTDSVPLGMLSDAITAWRLARLTYLGEGADGGPDPTTTTVRDVETNGASSCRRRVGASRMMSSQGRCSQLPYREDHRVRDPRRGPRTARPIRMGGRPRQVAAPGVRIAGGRHIWQMTKLPRYSGEPAGSVEGERRIAGCSGDFAEELGDATPSAPFASAVMSWTCFWSSRGGRLPKTRKPGGIDGASQTLWTPVVCSE